MTDQPMATPGLPKSTVRRTITFKAAKHTDAAKQAFTVDLSRLPDDRREELMFAGFCRMVSVATKDSGESARLSDIAAITAAVNKGDWPDAFASGGSGTDPVVREMLLIAEAEITRALKLTGKQTDVRKAIAAHEKGKKYFTIGKSGYALPNAAALLQFIESNPKLSIRDRAEAAVAARMADDDAGEVEL